MSRKNTTQDDSTAGEDVAATVASAEASETAGDVSSAVEDDVWTALVRRWVEDRLHGGPIARDTACFNALQDALPALRDMILKEVTNHDSV